MKWGYQDNFKPVYFFLGKYFERTKTQISQNQPTKTKIVEQKKNNGNGILRAQKLLRGWKSFVWVLVLFVRAKYFRKKTKQTRNCLDNLNSLYYFVILTYKTKHCVGFFAQTCKTKQTTNKSLLLRARKKVSISISFQT